MKLYGKLCVVAWQSIDKMTHAVKDYRAIGIDMGYTVKVLSFKLQDIAEVLNMTVVSLVQETPIIPGERKVYYVEV